jgi:hypothetical protein
MAARTSLSRTRRTRPATLTDGIAPVRTRRRSVHSASPLCRAALAIVINGSTVLTAGLLGTFIPVYPSEIAESVKSVISVWTEITVETV